MSESFTFSGFSFFSGVFTGFVLRWTDIIPIIGGFVLGFTVRKLPGFVNLNDLPPMIKNYLFIFVNQMNPMNPMNPMNNLAEEDSISGSESKKSAKKSRTK